MCRQTGEEERRVDYCHRRSSYPERQQLGKATAPALSQLLPTTIDGHSTRDGVDMRDQLMTPRVHGRRSLHSKAQK